MNNTPRTDAAAQVARATGNGYYVLADFARELEDENAKLRAGLWDALGLCDAPEHAQDSEWYAKRDELAKLLSSANVADQPRAESAAKSTGQSL